MADRLALPYLRTLAAARAAILAAGFDRVRTCAGALTVADWTPYHIGETEDPIRYIAFRLDPGCAYLLENPTCRTCGAVVPWRFGDPGYDKIHGRQLPACCFRTYDRAGFMGAWKLLAPGDVDPGPVASSGRAIDSTAGDRKAVTA